MVPRSILDLEKLHEILRSALAFLLQRLSQASNWQQVVARAEIRRPLRRFLLALCDFYILHVIECLASLFFLS